MAIDQVTLDILWARLIATTNDQAAALMRSSFTSIVRDAADLAAGVFDRRGRMIAQAVTGTPGHINSMASGMIHMLNKFPADSLRPGDVIVTNDPWFTASQLNDITIATPVFKNGRCIALFANCCHALDIGGRGLSADSRSVFEEGIQIPIMKLMDQGKPVEPLWDIIKQNVRTPDEVVGDLHCQIVGNEQGAKQLLQFLDEFDLDDIEELSDEIINRSERAMRARIAMLPDGEYPYQLTVDGFDDPLVIKAKLIVDGDHLTVDFTGSPGQVPLGVNVTLNYTTAYTNYGVKCALAGDIPNNEGSFLPLTVTAPEGTLLNAAFPAAVGGRHLVGHFLPSVVMGALADAMPDNVMAPGFDGLWDTHIAGVERGSGRHFSYTWFSAGGTGAMKGKDGMSATAYPSGIAGVPAETIETLAPLVVLQRSLRVDSGGPGESRGGLGQTMEIEVLTDEDYLFSGLYERTKHPAPGLHGGAPGKTGALRTNNGADLKPKITTMLSADTVTILEMPGGGGFGSAYCRDATLVLEDVMDGYVSVEQARTAYGVVIDPETMTLDAALTQKQRKTIS
ncbi:N-methylhydantoinase B [Roseovarius lutimaris]|uniref:N-methylhydantoinase B n=1 Tax=Roseovarius lutimaris TaxID=1005928 RepID=A0A1I5GWV2_9RHOB|nr:hydantoinase B/oxoprolinase family protein [Roseovarius lutimaris]SFO40534.1 N-methylhydantoinase B [Roseovarius lutimaris]